MSNLSLTSQLRAHIHTSRRHTTMLIMAVGHRNRIKIMLMLRSLAHPTSSQKDIQTLARKEVIRRLDSQIISVLSAPQDYRPMELERSLRTRDTMMAIQPTNHDTPHHIVRIHPRYTCRKQTIPSLITRKGVTPDGMQMILKATVDLEDLLLAGRRAITSDTRKTMAFWVQLVVLLLVTYSKTRQRNMSGHHRHPRHRMLVIIVTTAITVITAIMVTTATSATSDMAITITPGIVAAGAIHGTDQRTGIKPVSEVL